jgi:hypothetical protein
MAKRADDSEGIAVSEGFLCPVCHADFEGPHLLMEHFEKAHPKSQEDQEHQWPPQELGTHPFEEENL